MGEGTRVAGIRTFTLLGLVSGIAGLIGGMGHSVAAGGLVASAVAILTIGYAHRPDLDRRPDATTPIAGITTVGLGFLAGSGNPALAIVGATLVTLILALKEEVHSLIGKLDEEDVKALARFAVIAGAVLPFLPSGNYGPYGAWNPQKLWLVVVLVTGFSFLGYVTNRIFGSRHGTIATAIIGGLYSSTAVTQSLAQRLGSGKGGGAEPAGIALATAIMYVRIIVLVALLATRLIVPFATIVAPSVRRRKRRGLVALSQGAQVRGPVSARQPDRSDPGSRIPSLRRNRGSRRRLGGRPLRAARELPRSC